MDDTRRADIGVFGGSGFYSLLPDVEEVSISTPFGRAQTETCMLHAMKASALHSYRALVPSTPFRPTR